MLKMGGIEVATVIIINVNNYASDCTILCISPPYSNSKNNRTLLPRLQLTKMEQQQSLI